MRWRSVWLTACSAAAAVALAGCGGDDGEARQETVGPPIDGAVASRLADLSDEVASQLTAGDHCAARDAATELRAGVTEAIAEGQVPTAYLEELSGVVNEIEYAIPKCAPPSEPPPPPSDDDEEDD
ncbi:MAG TPA: hypothetical protein VHH55_03185 [Gaiellaceae bacterium]|jgi:hypothetical protein|nr:hypothetical protein [Gaiellaceae bacterium]